MIATKLNDSVGSVSCRWRPSCDAGDRCTSQWCCWPALIAGAKVPEYARSYSAKRLIGVTAVEAIYHSGLPRNIDVIGSAVASDLGYHTTATGALQVERWMRSAEGCVAGITPRALAAQIEPLDAIPGRIHCDQSNIVTTRRDSRSPPVPDQRNLRGRNADAAEDAIIAAIPGRKIDLAITMIGDQRGDRISNAGRIVGGAIGDATKCRHVHPRRARADMLIARESVFTEREACRDR